MKAIIQSVCAVIIALVCVQPVHADVDTQEFTFMAVHAFATGYVDLEIRASCLIQTTAENRKYVANETECRESLNELQAVLSDGEGLEDQIAQLTRFRAQYGI